MNAIQDIWDEILKILSQKLSPTALNTWFSDCVPVDLDNNCLVLQAGSAFKQQMIVNRFSDIIKDALKELFYETDFDLLVLTKDEMGEYQEHKKEENTLPEMAAHEGASTLVIYFSTDDTVKAVVDVAADVIAAGRVRAETCLHRMQVRLVQIFPLSHRAAVIL